MPGCWARVVAPGLICSPGTRSCSGPFSSPRPATPEKGSNSWLACQPAPCPLARSCSRFGCSGFPPAEQEEETNPRRGSDSRARVSATNAEQPRAAPRRRALLPGTTFHSHGARRGADAGRTRAPSSPPSLLPASLLGNIPPRPGGDGDLSPPPWGRGWRRELLLSPQIPSREHPRPYSDRDALVVRVRGTTPSGSPPGPWHLCKSLNKQQKFPNPRR